MEKDFGISRRGMNKLIAKAFDYFVIYPSRQHHNDEIRSKYYGGWGNYRDKPYGLEVRSLGGYFLKEEYLPWVYKQTIKTIEFCSKMDNLFKLKHAECPAKVEDVKAAYKSLGISYEEQAVDVKLLETV